MKIRRFVKKRRRREARRRRILNDALAGYIRTNPAALHFKGITREETEAKYPSKSVLFVGEEGGPCVIGKMTRRTAR